MRRHRPKVSQPNYQGSIFIPATYNIISYVYTVAYSPRGSEYWETFVRCLRLSITNSIAVLSVFPQIPNVPQRITNIQKKEKKQMLTDLQLKEKEETGVQGGVPLSAAETNLPKG